MKKLLMTAALAGMMTLGVAVASAADVVGYVSMPQIMNAAPGFSDARMQINLEDQKCQKEFEEKAGSLDDNGKLSLRKTLVERIAQKQASLLEPIQKKVMEAIKKVSAAQGITVVLPDQVIINGGKDLTKDVIAALK